LPSVASFSIWWDPIGIRDAPNAQDEYDGYLGAMFELLMSQAPDAKLKEYLDRCVDRMGMDSSRHSDDDVIQALRAIELAELPSLGNADPLA
jgi:hypothetical protein